MVNIWVLRLFSLFVVPSYFSYFHWHCLPTGRDHLKFSEHDINWQVNYKSNLAFRGFSHFCFSFRFAHFIWDSLRTPTARPLCGRSREPPRSRGWWPIVVRVPFPGPAEGPRPTAAAVAYRGLGPLPGPLVCSRGLLSRVSKLFICHPRVRYRWLGMCGYTDIVP